MLDILIDFLFGTSKPLPVKAIPQPAPDPAEEPHTIVPTVVPEISAPIPATTPRIIPPPHIDEIEDDGKPRKKKQSPRRKK